MKNGKLVTLNIPINYRKEYKMVHKKPKLHLSKPADRSLQAFKDWMQAMGDKLMPNSPPDDATEEEWIADHKKFWEGVDNGLAEKNKKST
jgi:hypothetical protein